MSALKKSLLGFSVALLMTSAAYADVDGGSGELHFTGTVSSAPCDIHPDDINQDIELGNVRTTEINNTGHSTEKRIVIRLINCDIPNSDDGTGSPLTKVTITFDSAAKTVMGTPMLANTTTGGATGVGVMLFDKDHNPVTLGQANPDIPLNSASSAMDLVAYAWMQQVDSGTAVTAGAVTANATYVLTYK
ncbi:type 1 fimbrial protein [Escherichia albertii]|uniref:fimbrial protein n=1 Tax=Escherichia albertii TaxID=208962 RepID=UPI0007442748|nr:fimbrial protein [Escherichia albertii]EFO1262570.1 type 1 fimbrial protein [Escherichia albertii]